MHFVTVFHAGFEKLIHAFFGHFSKSATFLSHHRQLSKYEEELETYLPVNNDQHMRKVFGDSSMRAALLVKMKKEVTIGDCALKTVRNYLFTASYQLSRCLSDRKGGHNAKVTL